MSLKTSSFKEVPNKVFILREKAWVKHAIAVFIALFFVSVASLILYAISDTNKILAFGGWSFFGGALCLIFIKNLLKESWGVYLFTTKDAIYPIFDPLKNLYIKIPLHYVAKVEKGLYGLNERGIIISIDKRRLSQKEQATIEQMPCAQINPKDPNEFHIKQLTGLVNRDQALYQMLKRLP